MAILSVIGLNIANTLFYLDILNIVNTLFYLDILDQLLVEIKKIAFLLIFLNATTIVARNSKNKLIIIQQKPFAMNKMVTDNSEVGVFNIFSFLSPSLSDGGHC